MLAIVGSVLVVVLSDRAEYVSAFSVGDGTEESPYLLYTDKQFYHLQQLRMSDWDEQTLQNMHFRLMKDITLTHNVKAEACFSGMLDGNGHTIRLYNCRMFYRVGSGGVIRNLHISSSQKVFFDSDYYRRVIASADTQPKTYIFLKINKGAVIEDCTIQYNVKLTSVGDKDYATSSGGVILDRIACVCFTNNGIIRNCNITGTVGDMGGSTRKSTMRFAGVTCSGAGTIEKCQISLKHELYAYKGMYFQYYGVAYGNKCTDCFVDGDITIYTVIPQKTTVYGIGTSSEGCVFAGTIRVVRIDRNDDLKELAVSKNEVDMRGRIIVEDRTTE